MGEVFAGRYELADPIGRGGAGDVWRAWDRRRGRYVAAKVLQQSDAHALIRFVREQALRIDHPHVLAPASWAADDDKVLFTMDLVSGGSLAHLIGDSGPLPPHYVCTLLDQLLAGLSAVHAEDIVHRDIKPANILLEPTGAGRPHLRLSDFGISMRKGEPRLTDTNFVLGTPGYFAPEQLTGADPDFSADLYAVGLVGLFLVTGRKPDSAQLAKSYANGVPEAPEGVPEPLWQVLGTLLQPDPQARFRSATGTRKALASAAELLRPQDGEAAPPQIHITDQLGPLPPGFGPNGPESGPGPAYGSEGGPHGAHAPQAAPTTPPSTPPPPTAPPTAAAPTASAGTAPAGTAPAGTASAGTASPTGSFHLPPPQGTFGTAQATQPHPAAGAGAAAVRKPGPPPKVAVPILVFALLSLAVGIWALSSA